MKKVFLALLATVLLLSSVTLVSSAAGSYTIPQCAVPPTIDGKYSSNEWYGAYHKFMNNEKGNYDYSDNPNPTPEERANQCKGYDIYMFWYDDPNESGELMDVKQGGLYFCVVAQDKTYGLVFDDGKASNASDCFQVAIDPFNYRLSNNKKSYIFDFSPETTTKGTALIFEHYQFEAKPQKAFKYQVKAVRDKNGYTMEIFIPWSLININDKLPRHKVGAKMGLGLICMDWIGADFFYNVADFGGGKSIFDIAGVPRLYNEVTLGVTVYPPGYKPDGDMTKLNELIEQAETLAKDKDTYLEATYSAFELALKEAKALSQTSTQATIDAAYKKLEEAIGNLKKSADLTPFEALTATIAAAEELKEEDYHEETWARFATALENAKKLTDKSSEDEIKAATEELDTAIQGLVPIGEELVTVDFTALTDRISKVEALKEEDYTAETWAKLKTAYDKAKELNGKDGAVQSEVDAAAADLDAAIKGLVKADGQGDANDDKDEKEGGIPVWVWIVIAAAVVIAAVVIVLLVLSKKKKTKIDSEDKE